MAEQIDIAVSFLDSGGPNEAAAMRPYVKLLWPLVMAALRSRRGHYIFVLWFLSFFLSSFLFLAWSQPSQIGCLPYFHTWYVALVRILHYYSGVLLIQETLPSN